MENKHIWIIVVAIFLVAVALGIVFGNFIANSKINSIQSKADKMNALLNIEISMETQHVQELEQMKPLIEATKNKELKEKYYIALANAIQMRELSIQKLNTFQKIASMLGITLSEIKPKQLATFTLSSKYLGTRNLGTRILASKPVTSGIGSIISAILPWY